MSFTFVLLAVFHLLLSTADSTSCVTTSDDFTPTISDIFLNNDDSNLLTIQISEKSTTSCRSLDTTTKTIAFVDISCDTKSHSWVDITTASTFLSFDIRSTTKNTSTYSAVFVNFLQYSDYDEYELDLEYYIHPEFYAWYYSSNLDALFILTVDVSSINKTEAEQQNMSLSAYYTSEINSKDSITTNDLAVIFVAFNPSQVMNKTSKPEYVADMKLWTDVFSVGENIVGSEDSWSVSFSETAIYNYDGFYIFQLSGSVGSCSGLPWFSYEMNKNLYGDIGNSSESDWSYKIKYIGDGYSGVDDRINRAYGYSESDVWWYDFDADGDSTYVSISFGTNELMDWWVLMWICVGILFLCVFCCCCICCYRKRKKKKEERDSFFHASV